MLKWLLMSAVVLLGALLLAILFVPSRAESQSRLDELMYAIDRDTGCEYLRFSRIHGITPRMEGYGVEYRHRGCRRLVERVAN